MSGLGERLGQVSDVMLRQVRCVRIGCVKVVRVG